MNRNSPFDPFHIPTKYAPVGILVDQVTRNYFQSIFSGKEVPSVEKDNELLGCCRKALIHGRIDTATFLNLNCRPVLPEIPQIQTYGILR